MRSDEEGTESAVSRGPKEIMGLLDIWGEEDFGGNCYAVTATWTSVYF